MSLRIALEHRTEYRYDRVVTLAPHVIRLRPAPHCRTPIHSFALNITPEKHFINWQQDAFGNYLARLVFPDKTRALIIEVGLQAEMRVINPFDFFLEDCAQQIPFTYTPELHAELAPYLQITEHGPALDAWMAGVDCSARASADFLVALNQRLQKDIRYIVRFEPGVQTCAETLRLRSGSCRDSAWLLVQMLRHLGLAARFVSGYLVQLTADQKALDGPSGTAHDFTDLHAWTEVYLPGAGWVGLDPTSGLFAGEGHIPLACTPTPASAAPLTGATSPCETTFSYHNAVRRIHEDPRVTKPYTEAQWASIMSLGHTVDAALTAKDVRLTLGGEPTFISIDDMDGAQWNTEALGAEKRVLAEALLQKLQQRFAAGALLHHGQGKWYPGEPLPRWALSCYWRPDGLPVWNDPKLFDTGPTPSGADTKHAQRFIEHLATVLHVAPACAQPGYEDVLYYAWREGRLPENVDVKENRLADALERQRVTHLFNQGLDVVVGYALPLRRDEASGAWKTSAWPLRRERLYLVPGDSPMGLRLPLDALPWVEPSRREIEPDPDPFAPLSPLPAMPVLHKPVAEHADAADETTPAPHTIIHTALCVEPRGGRLYCFLPPVHGLAAFLELTTALEQTAAALRLPIVIEGYEPPRDSRLKCFKITPDPGVIEVNIHPATNWDELVEHTEILYQEARALRLSSEKFMLDGRHTGTGGGNHVTLGGATAADSPFLRRPALLQSLVTYWQHHPSLSYLFSGLFIGPTSQAPRVDEARDDVLYELEIAFSQLPEGDCTQPWLVDRALRNLLVDITGNTHRAEFCIDKLYAPEGPAGRLGLVEFRGFEMPPHYRMSLAQMLLLRALTARFWDAPYRRRLIRWGTALHDRFMLPHFVWADFKDVIADLNAAGYAFASEWFAPFLEFRFPKIGHLCADGIDIELRTALEPWHVLGEETTQQGTARYVDSSVERLQISTRGLRTERYAVLCNGRRIPLQPSCVSGEFVAGVRYKAWQPRSGLHPNIPVHTPLAFDIVDLHNNVSVGGCIYHVGHPGGRNYECFPVNANAAEARRHARFLPYGRATGSIVAAHSAETNAEFPYTLDLRQLPEGAALHVNPDPMPEPRRETFTA